jgi:3-methyladenine DNA glycosylase AlkD
VSHFVTALVARLRSVATPERAGAEKRYLKSDLEFLGATVWQIRAAVRDVGAGQSIDHAGLAALVDELWSEPVHERRMAAIFVLDRFARMITVDDLGLLERLVRESRTWALVDGLAVDVIGRLAEADPSGISPHLDRWSVDGDFWVRRASLLAELRPIRHGAPLDRFLARADQMLEEKEFFIRKAIGWVLREAAKKRPDEVAAWLAPRTHRASGVTMREAVKYLPRADADRLMAAYREHRPAT